MIAARRFARDGRGVTAIEFAIVAPIMLMLTFGLLDLAFQAFAQATLDGAVNEAARGGTIEVNAPSQATLDQRVRGQVRTVVPSAIVQFQRLNYSIVGDVGRPEEYTDLNNNNVRDPGECFYDYNRNGVYDLDRGRSGQGGADDYVRYVVTVNYQRFFPAGIIGMPRGVVLTAQSVLRNQPYATQSSGGTVCA